MNVGKGLRVLFYGFSALCALAIVACLICDFAINRSLTWSMYVVCSVPYLWLIGLPFFTVKHKVAVSLLALTALSVPYLFLLDRFTPISGWFMPLGLPLALAGIVALWLAYMVFRYLPINLLIKCGILVLLVGAGYSLYTNHLLADYLQVPLSVWQAIINPVITGLAGVGLITLGIRHRPVKEGK